jgi:hypothetical protein
VACKLCGLQKQPDAWVEVVKCDQMVFDVEDMEVGASLASYGITVRVVPGECEDKRRKDQPFSPARRAAGILAGLLDLMRLQLLVGVAVAVVSQRVTQFSSSFDPPSATRTRW